MKTKSLYERLGGFLSIFDALNEANMPEILHQRVARNDDVFQFEIPDDCPLRLAGFIFLLNDFAVGYKLGKLAVLVLGNQPAEFVGGRFGFTHKTSLNRVGLDSNHFSTNFRPFFSQLSYAKRKTMVSWIKNGWGSAGDWGGLNWGIAP